MKLFEPLEELRDRFLTGWINFEKQRKTYAVRYEDGEDDVELSCGSITEAEYDRSFRTDFGLQADVHRLVEVLPTLRIDARRDVFERVLTDCAVAFALRHVSKLDIGPKLARFYVQYAELMRPDSHGPTIELAFATYVLDRIER